MISKDFDVERTASTIAEMRRGLVDTMEGAKRVARNMEWTGNEGEDCWLFLNLARRKEIDIYDDSTAIELAESARKILSDETFNLVVYLMKLGCNDEFIATVLCAIDREQMSMDTAIETVESWSPMVIRQMLGDEICVIEVETMTGRKISGEVAWVNADWVGVNGVDGVTDQGLSIARQNVGGLTGFTVKTTESEGAA